MRPICLDHLSLYDVTALELIEIAAKLDFNAVSLFILPGPLGPYRDLVNDRSARAEVLKALRDTGLSLGVIEPFLLQEETDWQLLEAAAAVAAELGGMVTGLCFDSEPERLRDSFGRLADITRRAGVRLGVEGFTLSAVRTPAEAIAMADTAGDDIGIVVDTLHMIRTGCQWADFAVLPAERIFHVQLCDGPLKAPADLFHEATVARQPPGEGEFDIASFIPLVPVTTMLAVEAPFSAPAGTTPLQRARVLKDSMCRLLA